MAFGTTVRAGESILGAYVAPKKKGNIRFAIGDTSDDLQKSESEQVDTLEKSLTKLLNGNGRGSVERLAFEADPNVLNLYQSVYLAKLRLLPDSLIKRMIIQDDLVAAIVRARETQMGSFGRPLYDRFATGYVIEENPGVVARMEPEEKAEFNRRKQEAVRSFWTCGSVDGVKRKDRMTFAQYLQMSTRNAVGVGRLATELVYSRDLGTKTKGEFRYFRPADAGTMFKAAPHKSAAQSIRDQALKMLEQLKGDYKDDFKIDPKLFQEDEYSWIQVIDSRPLQAFADDEMVVHNFFPAVDVELNGYPVTPLDTAISAVTTHINITSHNKIYFQTGRASHGMLIFKSDDVDEATLQHVKQQFNASINSVNNSWRMPVFSCGTDDDITWASIDNSSRDAEFQYLTDMNARVILSAFQMSPDELPGWAYLSRGTNNQSLSESNNEYRIEAARDQGIRPLLAQFEDFINSVLFPLIDEKLAKLCKFKFKGMDASTEEKEAAALQGAIPIHMTTDQILEKVEKPPIGRKWGGEFLLNPQWQAVIDKYKFVDEVRVEFFGDAPDPSLHYIPNPFYFQNLQMQMQAQQMQQQAQAAQAAPPGGGAGGGPGDTAPPGSDADNKGKPGDDGSPPKPDGGGGAGDAGGAQPAEPGEDLTRSIDQAIGVLSKGALLKGEESLPMSKRKLLAQHRMTLQRLMGGLDTDIREAERVITELAEKHRSP